MSEKRKRVIDYIVSKVDDIIPGEKQNAQLIRSKLEALSDKDFDAFIQGLRSRKLRKPGEKGSVIPFYLPNLSKKKVKIARMFKLVRGLNRSLSQRLLLTDPHTGVRYLSPLEYPCMDIPVRRQAQTGFKKRSIPGVRQQIDDLSGQPTALSKGSRISASELRYLDSRNLGRVADEVVHARGGAVRSYLELKRQLVETGKGDLDSLKGLGGAKSAQTYSAFLNAQHLGNNINPNTVVPDDALPEKYKRGS